MLFAIMADTLEQNRATDPPERSSNEKQHMKGTSLDPIFFPTAADISSQMAMTRGDINMSDLRHAVSALPFTTAYDFFRAAANRFIDQGQVDQAIDYIISFDAIASRMAEENRKLLDIHSALLQILTSIYLQADMTDEALKSAASTLNLLAQEPKRKDEPFLSVLASLLYDIALIHDSRGEHRQAERAIEKSMKIFDRLAKTNPDRYGSAHVLALNASTAIYQSREKQTKALAEHQAATNTYMRQLNDGIEDAGMRLVESLAAEGRTLAKMGKQREAIQYLTRALKYLSKISPELDRNQLELSIDLGEALLSVKTSREKGIHLLNTMLYKATKINADDLHRRIVDILVNAKNPSLSIFGFWHKLFPR